MMVNIGPHGQQQDPMTVTALVLAAPSTLPSVSTLLLALAALLLALLAVRAAYALLSRPASVNEVAIAEKPDAEAARSIREAVWSYCKLEGWQMPQLITVTLPVTNEKSAPVVTGPGVGQGMGVGAELVRMKWQVHRRSPGFAAPVPAIYESTVPLSAAKLIMSRHSYRRPNPNRIQKVPATTAAPKRTSRLQTTV